MSYNAQFVEALKKALNGLRTIHAVGEEWCSYIGQIPVGGVPYCGQEVTRSTYSALWSYAQAQGLVKSESEWQAWASSHGGNVPYYSSGNGSSTFRMPRIAGYVKGASSQSESGSYVSEGLPQVILTNETQVTLQGGEVRPPKTAILESAGNGLGGLITSSCNINTGGTALDARKSTIVQNASRLVAQDAIYGNSNHVTPETSVVLFGVYAFGEVSNVDALDAGTLASELARVESNLDSKLEKTTTHVVEAWKSSDGSSWYRKWSNGFIEQGGFISSTTSGNQKITFPLAFSSTKYQAWVTPISSSGNNPPYCHFGYEHQTTYLMYLNGGTQTNWHACGY